MRKIIMFPPNTEYLNNHQSMSHENCGGGGGDGDGFGYSYSHQRRDAARGLHDFDDGGWGNGDGYGRASDGNGFGEGINWQGTYTDVYVPVALVNVDGVGMLIWSLIRCY